MRTTQSMKTGLAVVLGLACAAAGARIAPPEDAPPDLLAGPDVGEPSQERTLVERALAASLVLTVGREMSRISRRAQSHSPKTTISPKASPSVIHHAAEVGNPPKPTVAIRCRM